MEQIFCNRETAERHALVKKLPPGTELHWRRGTETEPAKSAMMALCLGERP
jgi:hypothetical protein